MLRYEDITVVLLLIGVMLRRYVTMVSYISYNINVRPCAKALRYIDTFTVINCNITVRSCAKAYAT